MSIRFFSVLILLYYLPFITAFQTEVSNLNMSLRSLFRKVPQTKLGVSEPNPLWFGNSENERNNPNWTNPNWLKSRFHFSFAEYNNPRNTGFGVLRVMNDELVQPHRGRVVLFGYFLLLYLTNSCRFWRTSSPRYGDLHLCGSRRAYSSRLHGDKGNHY